MKKPATLKCVVWDLDGTFWTGTYIEGTAGPPRAEVVAAVKALDHLGVLQAVVSRNDPGDQSQLLERTTVAPLFLASMISWDDKVCSVSQLVERLGIAVNSVLVVDDQEWERDDLTQRLPGIRTLSAHDAGSVYLVPGVPNGGTSTEGHARLSMYKANGFREKECQSFVGTRAAFLESLQLRLDVDILEKDELDRARELTERTTQLNTTGIVLSKQELAVMLDSNDYLVVAGSLQDKYGSHGIVALAVMQVTPSFLTVLLLAVSCRVLPFDISPALMAALDDTASHIGRVLQVAFRASPRNRPMEIALRLAGFEETGVRAEAALLERRTSQPLEFPSHVFVAPLPIPRAETRGQS